ncbi:hypothetical protein ZWY2020_001765 [Hordeum vulgare]|nr:hypothetical protein ZWY2020_001765 [Hordeum vulgare]
MARWFVDSRGDAINGDRVVRAPSHRFLTPSPLARWFDGSRGDAPNGPSVRRTPRPRIHSGGVTPANYPVASPSVAALYIVGVPRHVDTPVALFSSPLPSVVPPLLSTFSSPLPCPLSSRRWLTCGGSWRRGAPRAIALTDKTDGGAPQYGLLVRRVPPLPWRVSKDGYPTLDDPATPEQLRTHPGGRHNIRGRHAFWDSKSYHDIINRHRQAATAAGHAGGIQRRRRATISPITAAGRRWPSAPPIKDKRMISKFNWNEFTLKFFLSEIGKVLEDGRVSEWLHGNLALLQYAYLEKVQPIICPKYDPLSLRSPLMRNWTEPLAEKRDKYDYDYGCGVGMTYMTLNKDNTHWVTVVMHKEKEELQVLDSLMGKELDSTTRKLVEDLRREIEADIAEANATGSVQYPDVSTWPIKTYDMPQQEDG